MNPTNLTNRTADELFYPADYGGDPAGGDAPGDRPAVRGRLRELPAVRASSGRSTASSTCPRQLQWTSRIRLEED